MNLTRNRLILYLFTSIYLIGGLIAITFSFIHNFNKEYIGLTFVFGCVFSFLISRQKNMPITDNLKGEEKKGLSLFSKATFLIFLYLSVLSVIIFVYTKENYYLPIEYFLVVSLLSSIVLIQILFPKQLSNIGVYLILLEILLLSGILSASFLFLFPGPYGNDSSYHVEFIKRILISGNIESYGGQYQNYPIYHLLFVLISLITGANIKVTQFILSIIQNLFSIFIFILIRKIFTQKAALVSTLFVLLSPYLLQPKYVYFPSSFATVFFILIIYLLFSTLQKTTTSSLLLVIVFSTMVFTHPLTPVILMVFLIVMFFTSQFLELEISKRTVSVWTIIFTSIFTLSWWMKPIGFQRDIFSTIILSIRNALETFDFTAVERATLASYYNWFDILLSDLGFTLLIFLGIGGAFLILNPFNQALRNNEKGVILSTVALFFIPVPYFLTLVYPRSLPARWFPFIEVLAGIFAGIIVLVTFQKLLRYKLHFIVVIFFFVTVFFMTTTPIVNPNNQLYAMELSGRSALIESENCAGNFIITRKTSNVSVHSSTKFAVLIYDKLSVIRKDFINPNDKDTYDDGLILIRNYDIEKGFMIPLWGDKKLAEIIMPNENFISYLNNTNMIYDNHEVKIYLNDR